jgi:hypothetical protein
MTDAWPPRGSSLRYLTMAAAALSCTSLVLASWFATAWPPRRPLLYLTLAAVAVAITTFALALQFAAGSPRRRMWLYLAPALAAVVLTSLALTRWASMGSGSVSLSSTDPLAVVEGGVFDRGTLRPRSCELIMLSRSDGLPLAQPSDEHGKFWFRVEPGIYTIRARCGQNRNSTELELRVPPHVRQLVLLVPPRDGLATTTSGEGNETDAGAKK